MCCCCLFFFFLSKNLTFRLYVYKLGASMSDYEFDSNVLNGFNCCRALWNNHENNDVSIHIDSLMSVAIKHTKRTCVNVFFEAFATRTANQHAYIYVLIMTDIWWIYNLVWTAMFSKLLFDY